MKVLHILAIILLLFNGVGAMSGGVMLVMDPSGELMQLPIELLKHSPFHNYFLPGIILLVFNGLLSLIITSYSIARFKHYQVLIMLQGCILTGWIIIQIMMLQVTYPLHLIMGGTGIVLLLLGGILALQEPTDKYFAS